MTMARKRGAARPFTRPERSGEWLFPLGMTAPRWLTPFLVTGLASCGPEPLLCPAPEGTVEHAGSISGAERWSATKLHRVTSDLTVAAGARLDVEPCTRVTIAANRYLTINGIASLRGEATKPITLTGEGGRFASVVVRSPGSLELAYTTISGGGANVGNALGAAVVAEGAWPVTTPLFVDHLRVEDSAGDGVVLKGYTGFAEGSTDLTITGSGKERTEAPYPLRISLNAVGSIPTGTYTGNAVDELQLFAEPPHSQVEVDDALRARGVPYRVGGNGGSGELRVGAIGSVPTLRIEAGVTIKLDAGPSKTGRVFVGTGNTQGALVAVGTPAAPIVFTTAEKVPAAGAWIGIDFRGPLAASNRLEFIRIEFAGAPGGASGYGCLPTSLNSDDAALRVFGEPGASFFQNSVIAHSLGHGVLSGWTGAEVDFKAGNTFDDLKGCEQVRPKPAPPGACASAPTCQ